MDTRLYPQWVSTGPDAGCRRLFSGPMHRVHPVGCDVRTEAMLVARPSASQGHGRKNEKGKVMSIGFIKDARINGRCVSQYFNPKTGGMIVFVDGNAVKKSFSQACNDCGPKRGSKTCSDSKKALKR